MRESCIHGSSPRVRGTADRIGLALLKLRFIPARAGNGLDSLPRAWLLAVHPRACGERFTTFTDAIANSGSSPRVRGTDTARDPEGNELRFIPARAGNGAGRTRPPATGTVHPRACGERSPVKSLKNANIGSSPRVRGTECGKQYVFLPRRFIPARAGNGRPPDMPLRRSTVHPRACGNGSQAGCDAVLSTVHPRACGERL